jgi:hypothetical protein
MIKDLKNKGGVLPFSIVTKEGNLEEEKDFNASVSRLQMSEVQGRRTIHGADSRLTKEDLEKMLGGLQHA